MVYMAFMLDIRDVYCSWFGALCWSLPSRSGQSLAIVLLSCRCVSLCVVRLVGHWCVRLRACVALRSCPVGLAESGNDISPKRAISPKRVLPTISQYIVYVRSDRWCGYIIWLSFRKRHLWHSLSGFGYNAKDATIKFKLKACPLHFP